MPMPLVIKETTTTLQHRAKELQSSVVRFIKDHPLESVLVATVIGAALGSFLASKRRR